MTEPTDEELDAVLCNQWPAFSMQATLVRVWVRAAMRDALAKWGTPPAGAGEPFAWADDGSLRSGSTATAHRVVTHETKMCMPKAAADSFNTPLYLTPQPTKAQAGAVPLTDEQITAAAKKLAECMDYPWDHMPEQGRAEMRKHAQAVIAAANDSPPPPPTA